MNDIIFNASVVLEVNAIEAVNSLLAEMADGGLHYTGRYKLVRIHAIHNDAFIQQLGFVSKNSTSWRLLSSLHDVGYKTAEAWVEAHLDEVGQRSSIDVKTELTNRVMRAPKPPRPI